MKKEMLFTSILFVGIISNEIVFASPGSCLNPAFGRDTLTSSLQAKKLVRYRKPISLPIYDNDASLVENENKSSADLSVYGGNIAGCPGYGGAMSTHHLLGLENLSSQLNLLHSTKTRGNGTIRNSDIVGLDFIVNSWQGIFNLYLGAGINYMYNTIVDNSSPVHGESGWQAFVGSELNFGIGALFIEGGYAALRPVVDNEYNGLNGLLGFKLWL